MKRNASSQTDAMKTNSPTNKPARLAKAATKCSVRAYIRGSETTKANVRAAPEKNATLLKFLKSDEQTVF